MNAAQMSRAIGQRAILREHGLNVTVIVLDARTSYGRVDLLVTPDSGSGERWVDHRSLRQFNMDQHRPMQSKTTLQITT